MRATCLSRVFAGTLLGPGVLAAALLGACKAEHPKDEPRSAPPATAVDGLVALPPDAAVVLGLNLPRLRDRPLGNALLHRIEGLLPGAGSGSREWLTACQLDPAHLEAVAVALGDLARPEDFLVVATGSFDPAAFWACVERTVAQAQGTVTVEQVGGAPARHLARGATSLWLGFGNDRTLLVAGSAGWLAAARSGPRASAPLAWLAPARLGSGVWFLFQEVGVTLPELGAALAPAGVKSPRRLWGDLDLEEGLEIRVDFELETSTDASHLASFLDARRPALGVLAQTAGLGRFVEPLRITQEQSRTRALLQLSGNELRRLEERLGQPQLEPMAPQQKGAPQ